MAHEVDSRYATKHVGLEVYQPKTGLEAAAGCFGCDCLFDDPTGAVVKNNSIRQLYNPEPQMAIVSGGTGPVESTANTAPTPAPTRKPIATTSAPTRKPIATTSAPTRKPTAAGSKSSKGVKATKGPNAKSSKNAKRG
eukprot:scaffold74_cov22-Cyclotella_meneghiniana.AAC.2